MTCRHLLRQSLVVIRRLWRVHSPTVLRVEDKPATSLDDVIGEIVSCVLEFLSKESEDRARKRELMSCLSWFVQLDLRNVSALRELLEFLAETIRRISEGRAKVRLSSIRCATRVLLIFRELIQALARLEAYVGATTVRCLVRELPALPTLMRQACETHLRRIIDESACETEDVMELLIGVSKMLSILSEDKGLAEAVLGTLSARELLVISQSTRIRRFIVRVRYLARELPAYGKKLYEVASEVLSRVMSGEDHTVLTGEFYDLLERSLSLGLLLGIRADRVLDTVTWAVRATGGFKRSSIQFMGILVLLKLLGLCEDSMEAILERAVRDRRLLDAVSALLA